MRFSDKIKYNIKRGLPALVVASAGLMASCHDEKDEPEIVQHDVELKFFRGYYEEVELDNIRRYATDKYVRHIYLTVANGGDYSVYQRENISDLHNVMLKRMIDIAPYKISGRGNFKFVPGRALEEDSLWFVKNGWTVNQHNKQK